MGTPATLAGNSFACAGDWAYAKVLVTHKSGKKSPATWLLKKDASGKWTSADVVRECAASGTLPQEIATVACKK